ncbi:MAG: hypothetical protein RL154_926 [Pseudomonadota bacterium]|jgi:hypothetical protein
MNGAFGLNGISGMLIATVLLLSILGCLGTLALLTQQSNASNFYKIEDAKSIKYYDEAAQKRVVTVQPK